MKKLVLILGIVFVSMSSFNIDQYDELPVDRWCFNTWTFVYNNALANGATVGEALVVAGAAFDTCVANQQNE